MPDWKTEVRSRLADPAAVSEDVLEEMAQHLEERYQSLVRRGATEDAAYRDVVEELADASNLEQMLRPVPSPSPVAPPASERRPPGAMLSGLSRDVRYAARVLLKKPGFTATAVLTLALGIGASTAIFSLVDQLLLRPLPYPRGDELVTVYETMPDFGLGPDQIVPGQTRNIVSPANWLDWQRDSGTLTQLAAWRAASWTLTGAGEPVRLEVQLVSSEFFGLLGVRPALGRTIAADDDRPNTPRVVVLSHGLWQQRFGGDPAIVGRSIQVNDTPAQVIGVMPEGFDFLGRETALWSPLALDRTQDWRAIAGRFMNVVGRLRPGTPVNAAQSEMTGIAGRLAAAYPFNKRTSVLIVPLREELTGRVQSSLVMLYGAVSVLLAIACLNVANLLLARAVARRRELAIRTSLGAGRADIIRQLVAESVLLAAAGGALGVLLAHWGLQALLAAVPADLLRTSAPAIDVRLLFYSLGLSLATGIVVGLAPAALAARQSLVTSIKAGGSAVTRAPRLRQWLVVGQVAMTVMLLCGAGLLVRTLFALDGAATGAQTRDLLTMNVSLPGPRYPPARRTQFFRDAVAALRALPGVEDAAAADSLAVIDPPRGGTAFHRQGTPELPIQDRPSATIRVVTPGYFRALGIPVRRGREFVEADEANPAPGFVVNEAFVRANFADVDPLSVSLSVLMQRENPYAPIIGVVGDVSEGSLRDGSKPTIFYSQRQMAEASMTLVVRARNAGTLGTAAMAAIHRLDPNLAVTKVRTFEVALAQSLARERLNAVIAAAFATSGLLLAALGLYGVLSVMVAERTKEIGLRLALGASAAGVVGAVVGGGLRLVVIGAVAGVAGSLGLLRSLQSLLFGVTPTDAWTYVVVLALLTIVASVASYLPARRASRIEPLQALRQE